MMSETGDRRFARSLALLDVLLAVSFLLIGLVPVTRVYVGSLRAAAYAENTRLAMEYLDSRLEQALAEARSRGGLLAGQNEEEVRLGGAEFVLRVSVRPTEVEGLNDINLRLDDGNGRSWTLSTSVAGR